MSITPEERAALDRLEIDQYDHLCDRVCDLAICATIAMREHADEPSQPITYIGAASFDGAIHLFASEEEFKAFTQSRRVSWMGWLDDVVFHSTEASE